jgi:hypothetical protein
MRNKQAKRTRIGMGTKHADLGGRANAQALKLDQAPPLSLNRRLSLACMAVDWFAVETPVQF